MTMPKIASEIIDKKTSRVIKVAIFIATLIEVTMSESKTVGKREFIQHTSKYIKWVEQENEPLVITHHNKPDLVVTKVKTKTIRDLRGFAKIKVVGDINEPVFPGYDEWCS